MNTERILIETQYFPSVQFFTKWMSGAEIVIEAHENYQKRSYRNRCHIMSPFGFYPLSVPLKKGKNEQQKITDTVISYAENWQLKHWRAFQNYYQKSPYFEHYEHIIEPIFHGNHRYLFDLNMDILEILKKVLDLDNVISTSKTYEKSPEPIIGDFRNKIHPRSKFEDHSFLPKSYPQVFEYKYGFLENLSVLDLIFNCGPEARLVIRDSILKD